MFWIRNVAQISPLFRPANGDPVLSEIDALLAKGAAATELSDRDALRLRMLTLPLGWGENELNQRVEFLRPKK